MSPPTKDDDPRAPRAPPPRSMEEIKAEAREYALSSSTKRTTNKSTAKKRGKATTTTAAAAVRSQATPWYPPPPPLLPPPPAAGAAFAYPPPVPPYPYYAPPGYPPATTTSGYLAAWQQWHAAQAAAAAAAVAAAHAAPDDDYAKFVRAATQPVADPTTTTTTTLSEDDEDDDEEDYQEGDEDDEEYDADDDARESPPDDHSVAWTALVTPDGTTQPLWPDDEEDWDPFFNDDDFLQELAQEVGGLHEEDMAAAVVSLLRDTQQPPREDGLPSAGGSHTGIGTSGSTVASTSAANSATMALLEGWASPSTSRLSARNHKDDDDNDARPTVDATTTTTTAPAPTSPSPKTKKPPTAEQFTKLQELLQSHYQLCLQQGILSIRAAHAQKFQNRTLSRIVAGLTKSEAAGTTGTTAPTTHTQSEPDDDDATLKQKYASALWMGHETSDELTECIDGAVGMLTDLQTNRQDAFREFVQQSTQFQFGSGERRLTRAQFQKTLPELSQGAAQTVFDIAGIRNLPEGLALLDQCAAASTSGNTEEPAVHFLLDTSNATEACRYILDRAQAQCQTDWIPGVRDLAYNFSSAGREYCGKDFQPPCSARDDLLFRRNKHLFTAAEDNLVLQGVNVYGEKQWDNISLRFLPERPMHHISQRYNKLCLMIYMANGVRMDDEGRLEEPPPVTDDPTPLQQAFMEKLQPLKPPAILNVHRWSLEEDLMLLKCVPVLGNAWAKLGQSVIPYRDRGHLRKRYQVLWRRVKSTMVRAKRKEFLEVLQHRIPTGTGSNSSSNHPKSPAKPPAAAKKNVATASQRRSQRPPLPPAHYPGYPGGTAAAGPPQYSSYPPPPYPPMYPGTATAGSPHRPPPHPYPYGPALPLPYPVDEASRIAFEKLAQDSSSRGGGDWSQMSFMHQMMQAAGSPSRPSRTSAAGTGAAKAATCAAAATTDANDTKAAASLLKNVLQKSAEKANAGETAGNTSSPTSPPAQNGAVTGTTTTATVYSNNGSPIGLKSPFRQGGTATTMSGASFDVSQLPGGLDSSNTMQSFPATSRWSVGSNNHGDSPGAPLPLGTTAAGGSGIGDFSQDSLATYTSTYSRGGGSVRTSLFGDDLRETDLEAASALNILSNSPALKRKTRATDEDDDNDDETPNSMGGGAISPRGAGTKPKSLFDVVVGKKKARKM